MNVLKRFAPSRSQAAKNEGNIGIMTSHQGGMVEFLLSAKRVLVCATFVTRCTRSLWVFCSVRGNAWKGDGFSTIMVVPAYFVVYYRIYNLPSDKVQIDGDFLWRTKFCSLYCILSYYGTRLRCFC